MKKVKSYKILFIQFGTTYNGWGVCLFDKLCYTSVFGFEILTH